MRIGTWNLNRRLRVGAEPLLLRLNVDVLLLTEAPPDLVLPDYKLTPVGPLMALGQQWSTIASREPLRVLSTPHPATTAATIGDTTFVCSVLPWLSAEGAPWRGEGYGDRMVNALDDLEPFMRDQKKLVWGGDWNHTLEGPLNGSTRRGRERLDELLATLNLNAPTRHDPRGVYVMNSIDHVAVSDALATSEHVPAQIGSRRLSDHDMYVVHPRAAPAVVGSSAPAVIEG